MNYVNHFDASSEICCSEMPGTFNISQSTENKNKYYISFMVSVVAPLGSISHFSFNANFVSI